MFQSESSTSENISYRCHCTRSFDSYSKLCGHAFSKHGELIKSLKLSLTSTSEVYEILEQEQLDRSSSFNSEEEAGKAEPAVESAAVLEKEKEVAGKIDQPAKVPKKRGRKPKAKIESTSQFKGPQTAAKKIITPKMLRTNRWVNWFGSNMSESFSLPEIDFKDLTNVKDGSKLSRAISKYISTWGVKQRQDFDQVSFTKTRSYLILFNTVLICEQVYLKWRNLEELTSSTYAPFFAYFISNFLPNLLRQPQVQKWMKQYHGYILMRRHIVLKEISNFLLWCRRNGHLCQEIHRNPSSILSEVLTAEASMFDVQIQLE